MRTEAEAVKIGTENQITFMASNIKEDAIDLVRYERRQIEEQMKVLSRVEIQQQMESMHTSNDQAQEVSGASTKPQEEYLPHQQGPTSVWYRSKVRKILELKTLPYEVNQ